MSVCVGELDKTNHQKVMHCDDIYVFSYLKVQSAILILHTFCQIQQRSRVFCVCTEKRPSVRTQPWLCKCGNKVARTTLQCNTKLFQPIGNSGTSYTPTYASSCLLCSLTHKTQRYILMKRK